MLSLPILLLIIPIETYLLRMSHYHKLPIDILR